MGTVLDNAGSVAEHVILSLATAWAIERTPSDLPLRYLDTHAMAPLNRPVNPGSPPLLTQLRQSPPTLGQVPIGAETYLACFAIRPGQPYWYPTHFVHAARVAAQLGSAFSGHLFEDDSHGEGGPPRSEEIQAFLADVQCQESVGLDPTRQAVTFTGPGCWRTPRLWPGFSDATRVHSRALVIMQDPLSFVGVGDKRFGADQLDPHDFHRLRELVDAYECPPPLTVHVVFCHSNPGHGRTPYQRLANTVGNGWLQNFACGVEGAERACCLVAWGSYLVFVGALQRGGSVWDGSFRQLRERITTTLQHIHQFPGDATAYFPGLLQQELCN